MSQQPAGLEPEFTVSDRLRKAREVLGMDQGPFAELIGVSRGTVSNYERGEWRRPPRKIVLKAWAMATGVSVEWIENGPSSSAPQPPPDGNRDDIQRLTEAKRGRARSTRGGASTAGYVTAA